MLNKKLYAPDVVAHIRFLHRSNMVFNNETNKLIDALFEDLRVLAPCNENGKRELWLQIDRGPIEAFGNYEEMLEDGEVTDYADFESYWKEEFPEEQMWFYLEAVEDNGYRVLALNHDVIVHQIPGQNVGLHDISDFISGLREAVAICINELKNNTYNKKVQNKLPYYHRIGNILRKDYWEKFPEEKEEYLKNISPEDIEEFVSIMQIMHNTLPSKRISKMTAEDFFYCCSLGYQANDYNYIEGKTWKEQYMRHADGRSEGLVDIDEKSPEAFSDWYHNRQYGGHPWEVCRGGNATHISLYVLEDEGGYYFQLAGSSYGRSIETIKFFLALYRAGVPIVLHEGHQIAQRLTETDYIGIVPRSVMPWYCSNYFPDEEILDFMHLPYENESEVIKATVWKPIQPLRLL